MLTNQQLQMLNKYDNHNRMGVGMHHCGAELRFTECFNNAFSFYNIPVMQSVLIFLLSTTF